MESLRRYGGDAWFNLGDRDLGTHLYRTARRRAGASLSRGDGRDRRRRGGSSCVCCRSPTTRSAPASPSRAKARSASRSTSCSASTRWRWRRCGSRGPTRASPAPGVLDAIAGAAVVVIAPSNPIVSIGPVLAVPGVREAVDGPARRRGRGVAHRGRRRPQGPRRPAAHRAGPRELGGGSGPDLRRAGRHPGDRHRRRRAGRRGRGRGRALRGDRHHHVHAPSGPPPWAGPSSRGGAGHESTRRVRHRRHRRDPPRRRPGRASSPRPPPAATAPPWPTATWWS